MNKQKFYLFLIIALLLSNVLMAFFLFFGKKAHPRPRMEIVIERLHFDKEQAAKYDLLIENHRNQIRAKDSQMMQLKNDLYRQLITQDAAQIAASTQAMGDLQKEIELIHFQHFTEVKQLCKPEQQQAFQALANDLAKIFAPHKPPRR
ncbi:MAG: Spy/CpxP family protein refolding chaperone [Bacteroidia bacterium]